MLPGRRFLVLFRAAILRLLAGLFFGLVLVVFVPFMPEAEAAAFGRPLLRLVLLRVQFGGVILRVHALLIVLELRVFFAAHEPGEKAGMLLLLQVGNNCHALAEELLEVAVHLDGVGQAGCLGLLLLGRGRRLGGLLLCPALTALLLRLRRRLLPEALDRPVRRGGRSLRLFLRCRSRLLLFQPQIRQDVLH